MSDKPSANGPTRIRVLAVDESVDCRENLRTGLAAVSDIEYLGDAPNGAIGLDKSRHSQPDLIIVSTGLPDMSVEEFSQGVLRDNPKLGVLISAKHDPQVADEVVQALAVGAFDFILKPDESAPELQQEVLVRRLLPKIRSFSAVLYSRIARRLSQSMPSVKPTAASDSAARASGALRNRPSPKPVRRFEVVVVGVSTGGPEALSRLIPVLPATFPLPVVVVLHMPELFTTSLVAGLDRRASLSVLEARDGSRADRGRIYLARGGSHLKLGRGAQRELVLRVTDDPPENGCKPSADVLFRSAARTCPAAVLAVILTGMGADGVKGLQELKQVGAHILAQNQESSVIWGMPGAAVRAGVVDDVLPLDRVADKLIQLTVAR